MHALIAKAAGWHEWIWNLRYTTLRAEIELASGDFDGALALLVEVIQQEPRRQRVKYQIRGLLLRARARIELGQRDDARTDLEEVLRLAGSTGNQPLWLQAAALSLGLEQDAVLQAQARSIADAVSTALGKLPARAAFEQTELVCRIRGT